MIELSESRIDKRQVKTLLRAALKTDWRGSSNPMNAAGNRSTKFPPMLGVVIWKGLIGLGLAPWTFIVKDPFMASLFVYSAMAVFLSITILLEFSNLILSPDEYQIVAPLPIGSKTFFVTKLIHLLAYVNILGSIIYLPSAVTASIVNQNLLLFFSFSLAGLLAATTLGMVFVVLYTLILKIVNRETMQRVSGYVQLILISLFYFGFFVAPRLIDRESLGNLADSIWLYLAPPAWFSAIAKLPAGNISGIDLCASFIGIIVLFMFFRAGVSRLSLSYAQTLSTTVVQRGQLKRKQKRGLIARLTLAVSNHEDRAVWKLIRKQFKYDNRFKMSILVIIPLTALYVYMGIADGKTPVDPFTISFGMNAGNANFMLYMAVAMLPFLVTINTSFSESYKSAWVFFASPAYCPFKRTLCSHLFLSSLYNSAGGSLYLAFRRLYPRLATFSLPICSSDDSDEVDGTNLSSNSFFSNTESRSVDGCIRSNDACCITHSDGPNEYRVNNWLPWLSWIHYLPCHCFSLKFCAALDSQKDYSQTDSKT